MKILFHCDETNNVSGATLSPLSSRGISQHVNGCPVPYLLFREGDR
jgi:hypothetical protein